MNKLIYVAGVVIAFNNVLFSQSVQDTVKMDTLVITARVLPDLHYITSKVSRDLIYSSGTRDIGEYLRTIPNVSGIRKGGSAIDPVVRGFKFSQLNMILNNGVKIENGCPNRMDPVSAHIEAEDIENIEVIKGPFVLKYGPSFGGVINLEAQAPKPQEQFGIHANALYGYESNWNGQKEYISLTGGGKKIYFFVSGGNRKYGDYTSGNLDGTDSTLSSSFRKYNYSASMGYALHPDHTILVSFDGVHGRDIRYPALSMDEVSDDTYIYSMDYVGKNIGPVIQSMLVKIYQSDVHHIMDNHHRPTYATMEMTADVKAVNTGGRSELNIQFGKHRFHTGIDFENIYKDGSRVGVMHMMGTTSTKISNLWYHALINNAGFFTEFSRSISQWEWNGAFRMDYNQADSDDTLKILSPEKTYFDETSSKFFNLSFNIGITRIWNENFSISLAAGRGTRSPNMLERYIKLLPVGYDNYDYLGNPQLEPETNHEVDVTLNWTNELVGGINLNGFYSYVSHYITANLVPPSIMKPQTQGVLGVKQFENTDYVTFTGFEFVWSTPSKYKLSGSLTAAYTYGVIPEVTQYLVSGKEIVGDTLLRKDALPEIPPFEATLNVQYRLLNGKLLPKITLRGVAGQNHVSGAFYEPTTPGFGLMNISARYRPGKHLQILAGINNVFDRAYYEHLNRKIIGTTSKLYEPGRSFYFNISVNI